MSKVTITLSKQEIEDAVLAYVNRSITIHGRGVLINPSVYFSNKDGSINYFECSIEVEEPTPPKEK